MNPIEWFTVYQSPFEKQRVGSDTDGGYVICKIPDCKYDCLISAGVADDISFEEDFLQSVQKVPCYAFDGTVEGLPHASEHIVFIKKNIDRKETDSLTNLHEYLTKYSNIFVKMDIEGAEYKWLASLSKKHLDSIQQLAIEIHWPLNEAYERLFHKLNSTHVLLHIHANCAISAITYEGVREPVLFECTYVNRKLITGDLSLNSDPLPGPFDRQNVDYNPEFDLNYPPFVHAKN